MTFEAILFTKQWDGGYFHTYPCKPNKLKLIGDRENRSVNLANGRRRWSERRWNHSLKCNWNRGKTFGWSTIRECELFNGNGIATGVVATPSIEVQPEMMRRRQSANRVDFDLGRNRFFGYRFLGLGFVGIDLGENGTLRALFFRNAIRSRSLQ